MKEKPMKVKLFNHQDQWTTFDNFIIDYLMPTLSPNAWKCLTVIIRKTIGWHKEQDELSFSQIMTLTGIRSSATVARALKELEERQITKVDRPDDPWMSNIYALNLDFEMDIKESSTLKTKAEPPTLETEATLETKVEPALISKVEPALKTKDTKERLFKEKEKEIAAAAAANQSASEKEQIGTSPLQEITNQLEAAQTARYNQENPPHTSYPPADPPSDNDPAFSQVCRLYQAEIGKMSPLIAGEVRERLKRCPVGWFEQAISKAAAAEARRWNYIKSILTAWEKCGGPENDHRNGARKNGKTTSSQTANNLNPANPDDWQKLLAAVASNSPMDRPSD